MGRTADFLMLHIFLQCHGISEAQLSLSVSSLHWVCGKIIEGPKRQTGTLASLPKNLVQKSDHSVEK